MVLDLQGKDLTGTIYDDILGLAFFQNKVTGGLPAPRKTDIAAKSLKREIVENTAYLWDVWVWSCWFCMGISNIQVRFQEFTLGIEESHWFALDP